MKWRGYDLDWCEICETVYYGCPRCRVSSCGGGGCDFCMEDWEEFKKSKWYGIENKEVFYEEVYNDKGD